MIKSIEYENFKEDIISRNTHQKIVFLNEIKEIIIKAFKGPRSSPVYDFKDDFFNDLFEEMEHVIEILEINALKMNKYIRVIPTIPTALYIACRNLLCVRNKKFIGGIFEIGEGSIDNYLKKYWK